MTTIVTFAALFTPGGILIAGALVAGLVELLKAYLPVIDAKVSGLALSGLLLVVLYVLASIAVGVTSLDAAFADFQWWLASAMAAAGVHGAATHVANVTSGKPS